MKKEPTIIVILLIFVASIGCFEKDDSPDVIYLEFYQRYSVSVVSNNSTQFSITLPYPVNYSKSQYPYNWSDDNITELNPDIPTFSFTNGTGQYEFIETMYGKSIQISANRSFSLSGSHKIKTQYIKEFYPKPRLYIEPYNFTHHYFYTYVYLDSQESVVLHSFSYTVHLFRSDPGGDSIQWIIWNSVTIDPGWNTITIYWLPSA